jgi:hypothetical protein
MPCVATSNAIRTPPRVFVLLLKPHMPYNTIQYNTWSEHWAPGRHRTHIHVHVRRWLAVAELLGVNLPGVFFWGGGVGTLNLTLFLPGITISDARSQCIGGVTDLNLIIEWNLLYESHNPNPENHPKASRTRFQLHV